MSCEIQPARHNHQPTHQQGTKWAGKAWPKMTKNANFGPNLVVFGQKILIFTWEIKSFGTHLTEKSPRHLSIIFAFFFGRAQDEMGQKCQNFAQNDQKCQFWAKFGHFWAKNPYFFREKQKFWYHCNKKPPMHLVCIVFWSGMGLDGPKMPIFGQKNQF